MPRRIPRWPGVAGFPNQPHLQAPWFLFGVLGASGCLKLNQEYYTNHKSQQVPGQADPTIHEDVENSGQAPPSQASSPTATATDLTRTTEASATNFSASQTDVTSSITSTSSPPPITAPLWIPITIQNTANEPTPRSAVSIQFDHRRLVDRNASIDGSDIYIYGGTANNPIQLTRMLDPSSSWNSEQTMLWFFTQQSLPSLASETSAYFLVVDQAGGPVQQDPSDIFLLFDDFSAATIDRSRWNHDVQGNAAGDATGYIDDGVLVLEANTRNSSPKSYWLRSEQNWQVDSLMVQASLAAPAVNAPGRCIEQFLTGFWSPHPSTFVRSAWILGQTEQTFGNHEDQSSAQFRKQSMGSSGSNPEQFHRYQTRWHQDAVTMSRDGTEVGTMTPVDTAFTSPASGELRVGFEAISIDESCPDRQSILRIDWVMVHGGGTVDLATTLRWDEEFTP